MFLLDTPLRFPSLGPRPGDLATVSGYGYLTTIAAPRNACVTCTPHVILILPLPPRLRGKWTLTCRLFLLFLLCFCSRWRVLHSVAETNYIYSYTNYM